MVLRTFSALLSFVLVTMSSVAYASPGLPPFPETAQATTQTGSGEEVLPEPTVADPPRAVHLPTSDGGVLTEDPAAELPPLTPPPFGSARRTARLVNGRIDFVGVPV